MSLSFEELADAGIPNTEVPPVVVDRSKVLSFVILACVAGAAFGAYLYFSKPALPEAAEILLSVEGEVPGVLPHALDSATEFEESFDYLKEGEAGPEYRAPSEVHPVADAMVADVAEPEVSIGSAEVLESVDGDALESATEVVLDRAPESVLKGTLAPDAEVIFGRDWGGLVLVPDTAKLAKAYTSDVCFTRVEAHPIDGERLRVWARIQNLTDVPMDVEVGCEFRSSQYHLTDGARFDQMLIPVRGFVDVQFVSPLDGVESYTVMVKRDS
jgi:hypothetical protein